jgi:hypothetical protein
MALEDKGSTFLLHVEIAVNRCSAISQQTEILSYTTANTSELMCYCFLMAM